MTQVLVDFVRWLAGGSGWLPVLVGAGVKATVLLAGAGVATLALRRTSAAMRHFTWSVALAGSLALPFLMMVLPTWTAPVLPGSRAAVVVVPEVPAGLDEAGPSAGGQPARSAAAASAVRRATAEARRAPAGETGAALSELVQTILPNALTLLVIWGVVALALVGRLFLGHLRVRRMARVTRGAPPWEALARTLSQKAGFTRIPRFVEGTPAAMPMTWGLVQPVVMLPSMAAEWPEGRLRTVLQHELAHVRRRDCLTQTIAGLVCAAYWFNPLAWIAAARLRAERERACDDSVLAAGADGGDYAEQLLDIARATRPAGLLSWATVSMARRSQLEGRLLAILDPDLPRRAPTRLAAALGVFTLAVFVPALAAVEPGEQPAEAVKTGLEAGGAEAPPAPPGTQAAAPDADAVRAAADLLVPLGPREAGQRPMPAPMPAPMPMPTPGADRSEGQRQPVDQKVLDALVAALGDSDEDVRRQALATLARLGDPRATGPLVKALTDASPEVREQAAVALARSRDPAAFDALTRALSDPEPGVREHAAFALGQLRDARAVDPLIKLASDENADVREQALFGLSRLRDKRAVPVLVKALSDADEDVREQAVFALGQLRDPGALPGLTRLLNDPNADVRAQAAFALGQLRDRAAVPALTTLLKDPEADVREQAVFALGQIRDASSVEPLMAALKDESPDVQARAALTLGQLRDGRAVDALVAALGAKSPDVRQSAAVALGLLRDPKATDALTAALKDPDADVREAAAFALSRVIGERSR